MIYNIEMYEDNRDLTILIQNISIEFLAVIQEETNRDVLFNTKFYLHGLYTKIEILNTSFMIIKNTKKNVILLNIS